MMIRDALALLYVIVATCSPAASAMKNSPLEPDSCCWTVCSICMCAGGRLSAPDTLRLPVQPTGHRETSIVATEREPSLTVNSQANHRVGTAVSIVDVPRGGGDISIKDSEAVALPPSPSRDGSK